MGFNEAHDNNTLGTHIYGVKDLPSDLHRRVVVLAMTDRLCPERTHVGGSMNKTRVKWDP